MNDRDLRLRCVELAAVMLVNGPGLDVVQTADKLFLYVSGGNVVSKGGKGKGC